MEDKEFLKEIAKYLNDNTEMNKQLVEANVKLMKSNEKLVKINEELFNIIINKEEQDEKNIEDFTDTFKKIIYAFLICIGIIIIIFCSVIV